MDVNRYRACLATAYHEDSSARRSVRRWLRPLCGVALAICLCTSNAHGAPVFGEVYPLSQPDGTTLEVRVWGDEFYRVIESLDGYTLAPDPTTGAACYARLSPDGSELISTGVAAGSASPARLGLDRHIRIHPSSAREKAAAVRAWAAAGEAEVLTGLRYDIPDEPPSTGNVQGILLLVDFVDEPATIPASELGSLCNEVGYTGYGNNGSIRDYFYDVSEGNLTYTNYASPAYYRAVHPRSYYDDRTVLYGLRSRELVLEALNHLEDTGFDFSQYDSDGDGFVDAINCFYAGTRSVIWAAGLFPHQWVVPFSADGVQTFGYQVTDITDSPNLFTFCHENGHMLCWWLDLYDYGAESMGVGSWCVMCHSPSDTNPVEPCAYLKYLAGWATPTVLTIPGTGFAASAGDNTSYLFPHPTKVNESYMIENRQRIGRDAHTPGAGLAIWHIDSDGDNANEHMTQESHYMVTLIQADGEWDLENGVNFGDSHDLYRAPDYTACGPTTYPNTDWWNGTSSGLAISDISESGPTMTFSFMLDCNRNDITDEQDILQGTSQDCNDSGVPDECELGINDCNDNAVPDECDLAGVTSEDCNANDVPDECDATGGGILVDENLDEGMPEDWVTTGIFSITDQCGAAHPDCGGALWAYAGDAATCALEVGTGGELVVPAGTLGYALSELQFCSRFSADDNIDSANVSINGMPVWEVSSGTGDWEVNTVDLRDFAGQEIVIRFGFQGSPYSGGGVGWQVDNIRVVSGSADCNSNLVPDECELDGNDCNYNGVPDDCEPDEDCNINGVRDICDIGGGTSEDCNVNSVPDECEPDEDCNSNGVQDICDIAGPTSMDCQLNGVPDECDIIGGTSGDIDGSGVPDECEMVAPLPEDSLEVSCTDDTECADEAMCIWGVCYAPKHRYISISLNPVQVSNTARRICIAEACLGWVGTPVEFDGLFFADVEASPVYAGVDFTGEWPDVVHVRGCEIATGQTYLVQAIQAGQDIGVEGVYSAPCELHTPSTWGDTVSTCPGNACGPPNGIVGLDDVLAAIRRYQGVDVAPITWLDIAPSNGASIPDQNIGVADILGCIAGFQGQPYPGDGPTGCPR